MASYFFLFSEKSPGQLSSKSERSDRAELLMSFASQLLTLFGTKIISNSSFSLTYLCKTKHIDTKLSTNCYHFCPLTNVLYSEMFRESYKFFLARLHTSCLCKMITAYCVQLVYAAFGDQVAYVSNVLNVFFKYFENLCSYIFCSQFFVAWSTLASRKCLKSPRMS